jgi:hypothetical protein
MQRESFEKALIATARIACCAGIFGLGCGEKTAPNDTNDATDTTTDTTNDDTTSNTDTADTTTDTSDTSTPQVTAELQQQYEECQPIILAEFPDGTIPADPTAAPQEVKDCCELTAMYYDALATDMNDWNVTSTWTQRDACCASLNWMSSTMTCTPWGPPMPSAFVKNHKIHIQPKQMHKKSSISSHSRKEVV